MKAAQPKTLACLRLGFSPVLDSSGDIPFRLACGVLFNRYDAAYNASGQYLFGTLLSINNARIFIARIPMDRPTWPFSAW